MKITALLFAICLSSFGLGKDFGAPQVMFLKSELDTTLLAHESMYHFTFTGLENESFPFEVSYSVNGVMSSITFDDTTSFEVLASPGAHMFTFYSCAGYADIVTDSIIILAQNRDYYAIHFEPVIQLITPDPNNLPVTWKPVIYLYPEEEMHVEVKLDFEGENAFLYPAYNDGWNCIAHPNGDLTIDSETYNYLFWEASQPDHFSTTNLKEGFIVEGTNAISFLKEKLTKAGLSSQEQADFITFWGPLIQKNKLNYVRFEFNETCDKFAKLNITPKPDQTYRIYIFLSPIETAFNVEEQEIKTINRTGFTVLEWGGQLSNQLKINASTL